MVFADQNKYSNTALRAALVDRFGNMTLGQILTPVQIVAYDIEQNKPIYFNSKDHPKMRMVDAALASSAAPTYFPAVTVTDTRNVYHCVDGGLFDNCSSLAALRFAVQNYEKKFCKKNIENEKVEEVLRLDDFTVVSIGTGAKLESSRVEKLKRAGLLGWAKAAVEISMTGTTQAVDYNVSTIFKTRQRTTDKLKYFRFQTMISPSEAQMDDPSRIGLVKNRARKDGLGDTSDYKEFISEHIESLQFRTTVRASEQAEVLGIERLLALPASANDEHK